MAANRRRRFIQQLCFYPVGLMISPKTEAFIPQILRLIFGLGVRRAGAVAARQAVSRATAIVTSRAAARRAIGNRVIRSSNVRSALKQVNRQGTSSVMTFLDAALILSYVPDLLAASEAEPLKIDSSIEEIQVEIHVQNQLDEPINAVLSILIYHDESMRGVEESFLATRQFLGTVTMNPNSKGVFVYGLNDLPASIYYIMPHAASPVDLRSDIPGLVLDPAIQTVEWI